MLTIPSASVQERFVWPDRTDLKDQCTAASQDRQQVSRRSMRERRRDKISVARAESEFMPLCDDIGIPGAQRLHYALGEAGSPSRELYGLG